MIIQWGHFISPPSVCIPALLYSVLRLLTVANRVTLDRSYEGLLQNNDQMHKLSHL